MGTTRVEEKDKVPTSAANKASPTRDSETSKQSGLAAPPSIDLGDVAVGANAPREVSVFNVDGAEALVSVRYEGSPSIVLLHAPERLRPSREGFDASASIKLAFLPTTKGHHVGTLSVLATWVGGGRQPEETKIVVRGAAHQVGEADIAEQEAAELRSANEAKARDDAAKRDAEIDAANERRDRTGDLPGKAGFTRRFDEQISRMADALQTVQDFRLSGVAAAEKEVDKFVRMQEVKEPSLVEELAIAALEVASVGIAGAIGKVIEARLMKPVEVAAHSNWVRNAVVEKAEYAAHEPAVAFMTEMVKESALRGLKAGIPKGKSAGREGSGQGHETDSNSDESPDAQVLFFQRERDAMIEKKELDHDALKVKAKRQFEPLLQHNPEEAIRAAAAMADGAQRPDVRPSDLQARETVLHWVRYVAQSNLGSRTASDIAKRGGHRDEVDAPVTAIENANLAPGADKAARPVDGLVDIEFTADPVNVSSPITVQSVRLNGVSEDVRDRVARHLSDGRLPIRAQAAFHPGGIGVIRDEAGNVQVSDESGGGGKSGNWFERRAGQPNGGADVALREGRSLMQDIIDIAAKNLKSRTGIVGDSK